MKYLNLNETSNSTLLETFYTNFIIACFLYSTARHKKDIEKFENYAIVSESDPNLGKMSKAKREERTVILLLDRSRANEDVWIGGIVCDYYTKVNQALIRYIVVDENRKQEEHFQALWDQAFRSLIPFSKEAGNIHHMNHIYFENLKMKMKCEKEWIFNYTQQILCKLGFHLLNIKHYSLLFSSDYKPVCKQLLVYHPAPEEMDYQGMDDIDITAIYSEDVLEFYREYWLHNFLGIDVTKLEDIYLQFKQFHDHLLSAKEVRLCELTQQAAERSTQVIVVGAGMAGLAASASLLQSGVDVVLVEAANYFGGRVKQTKPFDGWPPVDLGGELIHGRNTITYRLAVENNWEMEMLFDYNFKSEAEWIYLDGKMYPYHSTHPDIAAAYTAWNDFLHYCNQKDDVSAAEYFASHPEYSKKSSHIFNVIFCQTEAANLDTFGSQEQGDFDNSWECGPENFRLKNSQEELLKYYLKGCENAERKLNWQAKEINYSGNSSPFRVTVTNQNGEQIKAEAVIVCVPVTILKDRDLSFKPKLPEDKQLAIERIQMLTGFKIIFRFRRRFWPRKLQLVFNCDSNISQLWMYTNLNKDTREECHLITGFQTAEYARQKAHLTGDEVKAMFLSDLDEMFADKQNQKPASESYIDFAYYHWSSHPYVRGAYTSPSVKARGSREILARPLQDCVFFAGEATRSADSCTVSGAIESGIRAAEEVKNVIHVSRGIQ